MRQIGALQNETHALRLAAYLVTQGIAAHAEADDGEFAIWVRDENQLDRAREELESFQRDPDASHYVDAEQKAIALLQEEERRRRQARKNVVEMRGRWRNPNALRRPLTLILIGVCVVVFLLTGMGKVPGGDLRNIESPTLKALLFIDPTRLPEDWSIHSIEDRLIDISRGQVWRLWTPAIVHYGVMHLAFNMFMMFSIGSVIEHLRGTWRYALLVLVIGLISTAAESLVPVEWGGSPFGAGMSGVLFGLFGYAWMKSVYDPGSRIRVPQSTIFILLLWLFLGIFGVLKQLFGMNVGNWAHGAGLVVGMAIGYAPVMWLRLKGH